MNHVKPGPLLDIGCSVGYTLVAARALGALPFADGEFAMVTMKHVLEHTPDPRAALRDVRRVLRPGGGMFIAIPDGSHHKARRKPQSCRYFLPQAHGREHFVYYTPATLSKLVEQEGFHVVRVHAALLHRRASLLAQTGELIVAPLRAALQAAVGGLQLRKEFWLIAIRDQGQ